MKPGILKTIIGATILVASTVSMAADRRISLEMNDILRGQNTLGLKRLIKQQHPHMNLRNFELKRVNVVAKSKAGRGQAELIVGRLSQDVKRVGVGNGRFHGVRPASYERIGLRNYSRQNDGKWALQLNGHINLKKVVVLLNRVDNGWDRPPAPPIHHGPAHRVVLGSEKVSKYITEHDTFYLESRGVKSISIVGEDQKVDIFSVIVRYGNGTQERLYNLEGRLRQGEVATAHIGRRNVISVSIEAQSSSMFGSKGKYSVEAMVYSRRR